MPNLAEFMESITWEQDKLVMMGTIKPSKYQALVAGYSRVDSKICWSIGTTYTWYNHHTYGNIKQVD